MFSIGIRMARVKSGKFASIQLLVRGIIVESARVDSLIDEDLRTDEHIEVWVSLTLMIGVNFVLHDTSRFIQSTLCCFGSLPFLVLVAKILNLLFSTPWMLIPELAQHASISFRV